MQRGLSPRAARADGRSPHPGARPHRDRTPPPRPAARVRGRRALRAVRLRSGGGGGEGPRRHHGPRARAGHPRRHRRHLLPPGAPGRHRRRLPVGPDARGRGGRGLVRVGAGPGVPPLAAKRRGRGGRAGGARSRLSGPPRGRAPPDGVHRRRDRGRGPRAPGPLPRRGGRRHGGLRGGPGVPGSPRFPWPSSAASRTRSATGASSAGRFPTRSTPPVSSRPTCCTAPPGATPGDADPPGHLHLPERYVRLPRHSRTEGEPARPRLPHRAARRRSA